MHLYFSKNYVSGSWSLYTDAVRNHLYALPATHSIIPSLAQLDSAMLTGEDLRGEIARHLPSTLSQPEADVGTAPTTLVKIAMIAVAE